MAEASGDARMVPAGVPGCRINALPNDVLLRAISHLSARQLVQTCVLSRQWRHLWRSVPRINATPDEFYHMAVTDEECNALLKKFVNRFLMLRNPFALDEFRLWYDIPDGAMDLDAESADANRWIRYALQCNARSVVFFGWNSVLQLDPAVFAPKCCLTSLLLSNGFLKPPFFSNLQTGCTALERLILRCNPIYDPEISSQTLKILTINDECYCTFDGQASISIPSLIDLCFYAEGRIPILKNMKSLVTASVAGTYDDQVDDICQFQRGLSGVTDLEFYYRGGTLVLEQNIQWCPKFNNPTTLTLGEWYLYENFYPLIIFLQNSPNLEQLTLEISQTFTKRYPYRRFIGDLEERSFIVSTLILLKLFTGAQRVRRMILW